MMIGSNVSGTNCCQEESKTWLSQQWSRTPRALALDEQYSSKRGEAYLNGVDVHSGQVWESVPPVAVNGDSWKIVLWDVQAQGIPYDTTVSDGGNAIHEALKDLNELSMYQRDVWHLFHLAAKIQGCIETVEAKVEERLQTIQRYEACKMRGERCTGRSPKVTLAQQQGTVSELLSVWEAVASLFQQFHQLLEVVASSTVGLLSAPGRHAELETLAALLFELKEQAPIALKHDLHLVARQIQLALPSLLHFTDLLEHCHQQAVQHVGKQAIQLNNNSTTSNKEGRFMAKKAFRFGVATPGRPSRADWVALAQRVEELGYSSILLADRTTTPLAVIPALAAIAASTTTLRIGSYVIVNDYRNPALLAREIATLDLLSGGRVELGLGVGTWPQDFEHLGIPFDPPGIRVSRFAEGLSIIKQFFTNETVDFSGKYYTMKELHPVPKPVQQPHPPIMLGPGGRRMLTLAAREADIILPAGFGDSQLEEMVGWIREAAGERFEHLELCTMAFGFQLTDSPVPPTPSWQGGMPINDRPMTTEQAVEYLLEQREKFGFSYVHILDTQLENFVPVLERLNGK